MRAVIILSKFHSFESGFALVAVLWITALLAALATAVTISLRSHVLLAGNQAHGAKLESVADGIVRLTAFRMATGSSAGDGMVQLEQRRNCAWSGGIAADVSVQDQGGLVDLNTASPQLVQALLRGLGKSESEVAAIERDLLDFRDPDSMGQDGRPEPVTYPGQSFGPKNAPLAVVEELDQVPGISGELFRRMLPFVTVSSQQQGLDLAKAPQKLIDLLSAGMGGAEKLQVFSSPSPAKLFEIKATAHFGDGLRFTWQALIVLLRQPDRPFAILSWQRGRDEGDTSPTAKPIAPCLN